MNKKYEAVIIFLPDQTDDQLKTQLDKIASIISAHSGTLVRHDIWGRRQLAYRIKKQAYGIYSILIFEGDNSLWADLDRQLRINESVIRHLIVSKDKYAPDAAPRLREDEDMGELDAIPGLGDEFDMEESEEAAR